jgi:L-glutamine-phosphate cytidylyltransferase
MNRAILLAAGRGSRLGHLTKSTPKCLCPLAGHSLIEWQLTALAAAGIEDVTLVTGYRGGMLLGLGSRTVANPYWQETNMVASLLCAKEHFGPKQLVAYTDIIYRPEHVAELATVDHSIAITIDLEWERQWSARFSDPLEDAETLILSETGKILEIGRKPVSRADIQGQFMGLISLDQEAIIWIEKILAAEPDPLRRKRMDMTELLSRLIEANYPVHAVPVRGGWAEVDSPGDLRYAKGIIDQGVLPVPQIPGKMRTLS